VRTELPEVLVGVVTQLRKYLVCHIKLLLKSC
jgi:hypothetical protein